MKTRGKELPPKIVHPKRREPVKNKPIGNQPKQYQCPHCGVVLEPDDSIEGMRVDCPACGDGHVHHADSFLGNVNTLGLATIESMWRASGHEVI